MVYKEEYGSSQALFLQHCCLWRIWNSVKLLSIVKSSKQNKIELPWSLSGQDGPVEQAAGQGSCPANREDDGMQGDQHVALSVVGLQCLRQLTQRGQVLHGGATA